MDLGIGRRAFIASTAVAAAGVGLSACSSGGDGVEGSATSGPINIIGYAGIWEEQYRAAVIEPFLAEYPDITVNYASKRSSAEMLSAVQSEGGNRTTDITIMDIAVSNGGNSQGIFSTLSEEDVPNIANVNPDLVNADGFGPVVMLDAVSLLYASAEFSTPPESWEVLWDEQYRGKVNVVAPPSGIGINLTAITADMIGEDFTTSIDQTVTKLQELAPNVQSWAPNPDEYQSVVTGQTVLGVGQNARAQYYVDDSDGALGATVPQEGTVYQINTINLTADAPNPEAAKTFINYALSPEAQTAFAEAMYYAPSIDNAELPEEVAARLVEYGDDGIIPLDQEWLAATRDEWTERWNREIVNN
ncbi:ABC transporter substrate-binding protein [Brachybacterium paraconglomeratum]|uniref:ABC transporter substrate-binding protein n=1 Tax=Brachybacterium paraconglomeratum TaxID=173362 RepID=UPI003FD224CB